MNEDEVVTPTATGLRALAHPVRLRMLGLLRTEGASTATRLAARLGLNSGATSYHLRQLAEHGFVVEDSGRGNARERWWRAAHRSTHVPDDYRGEDSAEDARQAFSQAVVVTYTGELQRAVEAQATTPPQWQATTDLSDWALRLTPEEARSLLAELHAVVERHRHWDPERPEAPEGADLYRIIVSGFPRLWQREDPA
ncbi:MAG TPA: helix-turn-helix domain-containing protein [Nocardioidaceae bacterium]|nr:helix-turn-helix domain-containing protein [Nocardioidaceae bacterium]